MDCSFKNIRLCLKIILVIMLFVVPAAFAEDINLQATVDRNTVELGSFLQLTLTVQGTQSFDNIQLPAIDGFESRYLGPSSHLTIINGRASSSISFIHNLYPTRTGSLQIPPFLIAHEGKEYKTDPIKVEVVNQGTMSAPQGESAAGISLQDKIFLKLFSGKEQVFLNEKIPITIRLHVSGLQVRNIQFPEFDHEGFSLDDYQEPRKSQTVINGLPYDVVEFNTSIYPTRTGDLTVGPAREVCDLIYKDTSSRRSGGFGGFFDDDFLQGFFDSYESRPMTLSSNQININVLPLPAEGQPKDFSGGVGGFDFDMTLSPTQLKVGDPITLKMQVQGEGDLKSIQMPSLIDQGVDQDRFKIYEPAISEQGKSKTLEQVVIPKTDDIKEFPSVKFSYFDVQQKKYVTVVKGPFAIAVEKLSSQEQMRVVGLKTDVSEPMPEELGKDIIFIKNMPGQLSPKGYVLIRDLRFIVIFIFMFSLWLSLFIVYRFRHKIRTDERFARRRLAPRKARQGLNRAKMQLERFAQKEFYDTLNKTLLDYFGNKFHMPPGTITLTAIEDFMAQRGKKSDIIKTIAEVLEQCELVRFGSAQLNQQKMHDSYGKALEIIDYFERLK